MAFRLSSGRRPTGHVPNETELIALGCGFAMMFRHCGGFYTPQHSEIISDEVKRAGGSMQEWSHQEVRALPASTLHLPAFTSLP